MSPLDNLFGKLKGVSKSGTGWSVRCPAHDDGKASLSIAQGDDGRILLHCHAGCQTGDVVTALGLSFEDLFPRQEHIPSPAPRTDRSKCNSFPTANDALRELERKLGNRSAMWTYHNAKGEPVGVVVRWDKSDGKVIRPIAKYADGWHIGAMPGPRPLYGLPELLNAKLVVVHEGEKAAEAARGLSFVATTSAGGSCAAKMTDWRPLAGKEVWIFPDRDVPGRKYALEVAKILLEQDPTTIVKIIDLPGLNERGDIVDWIEAHSDAAEPDGMRAEIEAIAQTVESEELSQDVEDYEFKPFPVDVLPEPMRSFVIAGAKSICCDMSYLALPLLVMLASAIGNTRRLELKRGWLAPPILWGAIVGYSGTAKSPACSLVMKSIRRRQDLAFNANQEASKKYESDLACWEKNHSDWKRSKKSTGDPPVKPEPPQIQRSTVSDVTVEALATILNKNPRGVLLYRDELAGWVGSFDKYSKNGKTGTDSSNWLSIFNAESIVCDRKTGIPSTIYVPQASVCIVGGIQPGILKKSLGHEHRESGLAARMLLVYPPRVAKEWTEADIDPAMEAELSQLVDRLFGLESRVDESGQSQAVVVRLSPEAKLAWTTFYNAHAKEQKELTGDLAAAWSKFEEYAARLALVIHCVCVATGECKNDQLLEVTSMLAGIKLVNWFKGEARRVYSLLDESETDSKQRRLMEWIKGKGGSITAKKVQNGCRWLRNPGEAEAALDSLVKAGWGRWLDQAPGSNGGRPSRVFELTTASTTTKPRNSQE